MEVTYKNACAEHLKKEFQGYSVHYWDFLDNNAVANKNVRFLVENEDCSIRIKLDYLESKNLWVYNYYSAYMEIFNTLTEAITYAKFVLKTKV